MPSSVGEIFCLTDLEVPSIVHSARVTMSLASCSPIPLGSSQSGRWAGRRLAMQRSAKKQRRWDGDERPEWKQTPGLRRLLSMEIDPERAKQTHREHPLMLQWIRITCRPDFEEKQTDLGRLRPTLIWIGQKLGQWQWTVVGVKGRKRDSGLLPPLPSTEELILKSRLTKYGKLSKRRTI
jgi:hypothetical protein